MAEFESEIRKAIRESLGLSSERDSRVLEEAYVTQPKKFNLSTEFLYL